MSQKNFSPLNQFKIFQRFLQNCRFDFGGQILSPDRGKCLWRPTFVALRQFLQSELCKTFSQWISALQCICHILTIFEGPHIRNQDICRKAGCPVKQKIRRRGVARCMLHLGRSDSALLGDWSSVGLDFGVGAAPGFCDSSPSLSHNPVSRSILLHVKAALSAGDPKYPKRVPTMLGKSKSMSWMSRPCHYDYVWILPSIKLKVS